MTTPIIRRHMSQRNWHLGPALVRGSAIIRATDRAAGGARRSRKAVRTQLQSRERVKQSIFRSGYGKWIASLRSR